MENTNTPAGAPPENNLVWAILSTVLCCWPIGIVAIIKATKVKELWLQGDHAGAQKAADDAKKYSIWSAAVLGILGILYIVFVVIFGIAGNL